MSELTLQINNQAYGGWTEVRVQRGIEQIAGVFELSVTERWPEQPINRPVRPGDACKVRIGGKTIITGHVDDVAPSYDAQSHTISVRGRDATGDLVDCSAIYKQWNGQTLAQVAKAVCKPFGIAVDDQVGDPYTFTELKTDTGESVFELLDRAARHVGVLLMSDGLGNLVITRAGTSYIGNGLELGRNIKRASGNFSHRDRFSEYRVIGQHAGSDSWSGAEAAAPAATVRDTRITRHRPFVVTAEEMITPDKAKRRGEWQRNVNYGRSLPITYTVQGWEDHAGNLWQPNRLVRIADSFMGITDSLLIVSVAFTLSNDNGAETELRVMPREAFDLVPIPESSDGTWVS